MLANRVRVTTACGCNFLYHFMSVYESPEARGTAPRFTEKQRKLCVDAWFAS